MKLRFTAILFLLSAIQTLMGFQAKGQIYDPVQWTFEVVEKTDEYAVLAFKAEIEAGWHLYATELSSDEGPIPTSINFEKSDDYELVGELIEPEPITKYDPNFMMDLS